jgi:hypothetical protein
MNFKEWLVNEGFLGLPFSVYKKVVDFYIAAERKHMSGINGVISDVLPLDFEGTNFDFLAYLNPKVKVNVHNAEMVDGAGGYYLPSGMQRTPEGVIGEIALASKSFGTMDSTIEHELLHFVQDLIKIHAMETVANNPNRRDKRWTKDGSFVNRLGNVRGPGAGLRRDKKNKNSGTIRLGGLPEKKALSDMLGDYDVDGYVRGSKKQRRTTHGYRPIEQMTNLNTKVMELRFNYLANVLKQLGIDPTEKTWEELQANPEFMKLLGDKEKKRVTQTFKDLGPTQRLYQKEIFKRYTDSTDWRDTFEMIKSKKSLRKIIKQDEQERAAKNKESGMDLKGYSEEDFGKGVRVKIEYYDRLDFSIIDELVPEEDRESVSTYDSAEEMFSKIGIKEDSEGFYSFAANPKNLFKIFGKIKQHKQNETEKEKRCDWDHFAEKLAESISYKLSDYMFKKKHKQIDEKQILDIFYPGPYESCLKDTE